MLIIDGLNASWHTDPVVLDHHESGTVSAVNATVAANHDTLWTVQTITNVLAHIERNSTRATLIETEPQVELAMNDGKVGFILGFQDTVPIGDNLDLLRTFHKLGLRVLQLTYNFENLVGCGCLCDTDSGLTEFGRQVIAECNRLGILIDLSHCGPRTTNEAIEASEMPVAITHSNSTTTLPHPRNKSPELIEKLAAAGGVIGAVAVPPLLTTSTEPTIDDYVVAIEELIRIAGPDHVGLGADFMEAMPAEVAATVTQGLSPEAISAFSSLPTVRGFDSPACYPDLAEHLRDRGCTDELVRKIMGCNWLRLYRQTWSDG